MKRFSLAVITVALILGIGSNDAEAAPVSLESTSVQTLHHPRLGINRNPRVRKIKRHIARKEMKRRLMRKRAGGLSIFIR